MTSRLQRTNLERANADLQDIQDIASKTLEHILVRDEKLKQMSKKSDDLVFETASYRDDAVKFKKMVQRNKWLILIFAVVLILIVIICRHYFF
ncbi:hypothetical protein KM1_074410 [Entamoeba histolytica HM-3:IMSS]|uniref:Cellulose synthase n=2 Tax=Entamoeba histolytica TaxID=5759 RepID=A0A175JFJ3_ENTHI|nr:hypothetical protein KM1_074410 [Entamoeba histolytica HM-3:IMSS]GAT92276.1 cellulose synthase [Entamoeba histolytica]